MGEIKHTHHHMGAEGESTETDRVTPEEDLEQTDTDRVDLDPEDQPSRPDQPDFDPAEKEPFVGERPIADADRPEDR